MENFYNSKIYTSSSNSTSNSTEKEEEVIDLRQIFIVFAAKWYLIVLAAFVVGIIVFSYFNFIAVPKYTASTNIMVINRQNEGTVSNSDLSASTTLSSDYVQIIKNVSVVDKVIDNLGLNVSVGSLTSRITATNISGTRMITISVEDEDPEQAMKIANEMATVSADKICEVMDIENMVSIVNEAQLPTSPSSPTTLKYTLLAFIGTFILMWIVIFVASLLDDKIKSSEDIEKYLGLPVLALVPFDEQVASETGRKSSKKSSNKSSKKSSSSKANVSKVIQKEEKATNIVQEKSEPKVEDTPARRAPVANQPQRRQSAPPQQRTAAQQVQKQPEKPQATSSRIHMVDVVDVTFDDGEA